jgi:hypothetical protein
MVCSYEIILGGFIMKIKNSDLIYSFRAKQ